MSASAGQRGFVLPLALVALAALSVALAVASDAAGGAGALQRRREAEWRLDLGARGVEAEVARQVLVGEVRARDVVAADGRVLFVDGRLYSVAIEGVGRVFFSVQDTAGLFNLNRTDEAALQTLLEAADVPRREARNLAASLADHVDEDDLDRLNGAELRDGRQTNVVLVDPRDGWMAAGWARLTQRQTRRLLPLVTAADPDQPFNPNTAPPDVLAAVLGLEPRAVSALVAERERDTIEAVDEGVATAPVSAQPSGEFVIVVWPETGPARGSVRIGRMHLAGPDDGAPVLVRWTRMQARDWERRNVDGRLEWISHASAVRSSRLR